MNVLLLKAWLREHGPGLIGARLRAATQLDQRSIMLELATDEGPRSLLLSVLEEYPVLAMVDDPGELAHSEVEEGNFTKALNFHLAGYRLVSIEQAGFDRSVVLTFKHKDTYGETLLKLLRHELVGRASNAFLISEKGMVVSIMKRVRKGQNTVRHILTGKPLPPPPPLGKFVAIERNAEELAGEIAASAEREGIETEHTLKHFFSRQVAGGDLKLWPRLEPLLPVEYDFATLHGFIRELQKGDYTSQLFGLSGECPANCVALKEWQAARQRRGLKQQPVDPKVAKARKRLDQLIAQLKLSQRADEVEALALEMLKQSSKLDEAGGSKAAAYLTEWQAGHVEFAAEVSLTASVYDNAQGLVHYAQRLKRGKDKLGRLIKKTEDELHQLQQGALAGKRKKKPADPLKSQQNRLSKYGVKYLRFVSSDGLHILCGVNDLSNDGLMRVYGSSRHLWLHARDYPGSHVIVLSAGKDVPRRTLEEAAVVAAHYSKGQGEGDMEVSYLPMKHLRRPRDGKPGQVLKMQEKVITVRPVAFKEIEDAIRWRGE